MTVKQLDEQGPVFNLHLKIPDHLTVYLLNYACNYSEIILGSIGLGYYKITGYDIII